MMRLGSLRVPKTLLTNLSLMCELNSQHIVLFTTWFIDQKNKLQATTEQWYYDLNHAIIMTIYTHTKDELINHIESFINFIKHMAV